MLNNIKKDVRNGIFLLIIAVIAGKIIFINESVWIISKVVVSLAYLFWIPGYALLLHWYESFPSMERWLLSFAVGAAWTGSIGFLLGLIGIKMDIQLIVVPLLGIIIGLIIGMKKGKESVSVAQNSG